MRSVKLFESDFDSAEMEAASEVVRSGWLTNGDKTSDFEMCIAEFLGLPIESVTAVSSCTAALHISLILSGVGHGDEVLVPALNFVSDANVCVAVGATPIFCDIESESCWTPSVDRLERFLSKNTKAVIVTHFAGIPAREILEIASFCEKHELKLIEDCAHATGSSIEGTRCGTIGDYAAFSFYSNKNIATGEGGALVAKDDPRGKLIRSHGMTTSTLDREKGRAFSYDVAIPGLNYRIDEIRAAIGICQFKKFDKKHRLRRGLVDHYLTRLTEAGLVSPHHFVTDNMVAVDHIMPVLLPTGSDRSKIMKGLLEEGIQSSIHYPAPWSFAAYKDLDKENFPVADRVISSEITLPLHTRMSTDDVDWVVDKLLDHIL